MPNNRLQENKRIKKHWLKYLPFKVNFNLYLHHSRKVEGSSLAQFHLKLIQEEFTEVKGRGLMCNKLILNYNEWKKNWQEQTDKCSRNWSSCLTSSECFEDNKRRKNPNGNCRAMKVDVSFLLVTFQTNSFLWNFWHLKNIQCFKKNLCINSSLHCINFRQTLSGLTCSKQDSDATV